MKIFEEINLIEELKQLIEKQIEFAMQGNFTAAEKLAIDADMKLNQLLSNDSTQIPDFEIRKQELLKLYRKLELMLSAERQIVREQMKTVDNVRKTLTAYSNKAL